MLIRFEASNYRSIDDPVELSMVAIDRDREAAREEPMLGESLLPVAAVFGPNASGKSNIIAAFAWLRDAVQHSLRTWDEEIPVEPFAFGAGPTAPSQFTVESTIDGVRFEYVLELDAAKVRYEGLFHYPEKKRRRIFEREGQELKLQRGLGKLSGTRELLTERTLALSIARRFDEPLVSDFSRTIVRTQTLGPVRRHGTARNRDGRPPSTHQLRSTFRFFQESDQPSLFEEGAFPNVRSDSDRERALALLRLADLGIDDVVIDPGQTGLEPLSRRIRLVHRIADERASLEFAAESDGTRTWFHLIGPVLTALHEGSLLLFDELDASLHPTLSAQLVHLFHDPGTNPLGAQLVFTSHDTNLLNHLNRDEVWLTEKNSRGATRLGALAEFAGERVRKSQNLETAYLHGRFGALPQVDQADFLRSLGLIG
ncbi:ATP/GTP-binding protein [Amycolatopsis halotolerans]|uniref:ATP/GTP-binding protein n=1 Tax=Amycolatopsis halotolerans TaxID=330083 RepID=A0ABV7QCJ7_9PSEU